MMLARAAERVYWLGRYLERTENTARVIQQHSQLLLDLPDEVGVDWFELVKILGAEEDFENNHRARDEKEIIEYLLADPSSVSSLHYSLRMARENLRNTRDLLPHESWESLNELYQYGCEKLPGCVQGEERFEVLSEIIGRCQQINGALLTTMSHRSPLQFLRMGQNLERADMMTRVIDVAANYIQHNERLVKHYGSTLWTNVLKSVTGFQMYRQYVQIQVRGNSVVRFLINDGAFPRSIRHCIDAAASSADKLPNSQNVVARLSEVYGEIDASRLKSINADQVSRLMDIVQTDLSAAHDAVCATWFIYESH